MILIIRPSQNRLKSTHHLIRIVVEGAPREYESGPLATVIEKHQVSLLRVRVGVKRNPENRAQVNPAVIISLYTRGARVAQRLVHGWCCSSGLYPPDVEYSRARSKRALKLWPDYCAYPAPPLQPQ